MIDNHINGFDKKQWQDSIRTKPYWPVLKQMQEQGYKLDHNALYRGDSFKTLTPRERYFYPTFHTNSLYYIDAVQAQKPQQVFDIGCGMNVWKKFYDNIIGVDPQDPRADIRLDFDRFKQAYIESAYGLVDSCISIGTMNMFVSIKHLLQNLCEFIKCTKIGYRGYVTINLCGMMSRGTPKEHKEELFGVSNPDAEQVSKYCNAIVEELPGISIIIYDNFITDKFNEYMDGNLRLVFEREV